MEEDRLTFLHPSGIFYLFSWPLTQSADSRLNSFHRNGTRRAVNPRSLRLQSPWNILSLRNDRRYLPNQALKSHLNVRFPVIRTPYILRISHILAHTLFQVPIVPPLGLSLNRALMTCDLSQCLPRNTTHCGRGLIFSHTYQKMHQYKHSYCVPLSLSLFSRYPLPPRFSSKRHVLLAKYNTALTPIPTVRLVTVLSVIKLTSKTPFSSRSWPNNHCTDLAGIPRYITLKQTFAVVIHLKIHLTIIDAFRYPRFFCSNTSSVLRLGTT